MKAVCKARACNLSPQEPETRCVHLMDGQLKLINFEINLGLAIV